MSDDADTDDETVETESGDPAEWWDEVYDDGDPAPWDTGEPQPAFVEVADAGAIRGRVLDAGCGTGTHVCWVAERGHPAVGVDVSERGVERARAKAEERDLDATFRVADALDLPDDLGEFDTVLDSGLFHAFETDQRDTYADSLAGVVRPGGQVSLVGFGEGAPEDWGPDPFAPADVRAAFGDGWRVRDVRETEFETRETSVPGLSAKIERV